MISGAARLNWPEGTDPERRIADDRYATAIDRPASRDELRETVARRLADGAAIYPRGGGTAMATGGIPAAPGVLVETRGLDRILDYPAADMTITVEAGQTLAGLGRILAEQGQQLLLEAPRPEAATLGGIFATATCGPRRFGWGRPRDQILGVGFVNGEGKFVQGGGRVVKNVAGYDLPKLLTGSYGTLGVICQMTLKVRPKAESTALALVPFASMDDLGNALKGLNTSATRPVALDVLNLPAAGQVLGAAGPGSAWTLVVGFEDAAPAVLWQIDALRREMGPAGDAMTVARDADAEPLWAALADHAAAEPGAVSIRIGMKRSLLPALMATIDPGTWALQAHAGNGLLIAHTLGDPGLDELGPRIDRLRQAAALPGGHLTVSRCPGAWKARLKVWGDPRPDWALGERVRRALDPAGLMNPGRFVGTI